MVAGSCESRVIVEPASRGIEWHRAVNTRHIGSCAAASACGRYGDAVPVSRGRRGVRLRARVVQGCGGVLCTGGVTTWGQRAIEHGSVGTGQRGGWRAAATVRWHRCGGEQVRKGG